jgi:hypothetical protein
VLKGYFSQTYRPGHHNISEKFLYEPRLEPGISEEILDELKQQDIRLFYMQVGFFGNEDCIQTFRFDQSKNAADPPWMLYH